MRYTNYKKMFATTCGVGSDLFKPVQTFPHLLKIVHTWSHLFTPVPTCSHLFTPVHNCSHLFTPVHTYSQRFTPVHTSVTIYALRSMAVSRWIFPLRKLFFFDLTCYLVEMAYFCSPNRDLIESYSTVSCLCSCIGKKVDPSSSPYLKIVDGKRFERCDVFGLTSCPAELSIFQLS